MCRKAARKPRRIDTDSAIFDEQAALAYTGGDRPLLMRIIAAVPCRLPAGSPAHQARSDRSRTARRFGWRRMP